MIFIPLSIFAITKEVLSAVAGRGRVCASFLESVCSDNFMEQKPFTAKGLARIFNATGYSFKGIQRAWTTEAAVRQEFILAGVMLPIAFLVAQSLPQLVLLGLSLFIVVITELLNTAIEYCIDRIGSERHDLSGAAKDIASAAVFFSLMQVVFVWGCVIAFNLGWLNFG